MCVYISKINFLLALMCLLKTCNNDACIIFESGKLSFAFPAYDFGIVVIEEIHPLEDIFSVVLKLLVLGYFLLVFKQRALNWCSSSILFDCIFRYCQESPESWEYVRHISTCKWRLLMGRKKQIQSQFLMFNFADDFLYLPCSTWDLKPKFHCYILLR